MRDFPQYAGRFKTSFFFELSSSSMQNCLVRIIDLASWDLLFGVSTVRLVASSLTHPEIRERSFLRCTLHDQQLAFFVEHNCACDETIVFGVLLEIVLFRYRVFLQRIWIVERFHDATGV